MRIGSRNYLLHLLCGVAVICCMLLIGQDHPDKDSVTEIKPKDKKKPPICELGQHEEYQRRIHRLEEACHRLGTPQVTEMQPYKMSGSLLVEKFHSIIYCNIPKVSSTFMWYLLKEIHPSNTNPKQFKIVRADLSESELNEFLKNAFSFMIVRDPYARLYSGYENKIYLPNISFWKKIGRKVVATIRQNASTASLKYGHDVTFFEFVKYILKLSEEGKTIDEHFAPMHMRCDPCHMPFHFLGKLETFKNDAEYLLALWKARYPDIRINITEETKRAMNIARSLIRFLYQAWNSIKHDISYPFYNFLQRTWCDNHIRGLLSKKISLPLKPSEVSHLTREDVAGALQKAIDMPANRTEVKLQREEALIQAYRTIPIEYMEKLRQYVLKDCQLFGYDDRPDKLFNRSVPYTNEHLYMKGI